MLGKGVYLTSLPPWTSDMKLLKNNWDGRSERTLWSKVENLQYYIEFKSKHLPGVIRSSGKRDVWVVPYDIDLDDVPHEIFVRGENIAVARRHGYL
jgi:hypothetical protein